MYPFSHLAAAVLTQIVNRGDFTAGTAETIYSRVLKFCQDDILSDARYQRDFMEEIYDRLKGYRSYGTDELKDANDISDYILLGVDECSYYLCRDTFGGFDIHQEMCMYLNAESQFINVKDTKAVAANQIRNDRLRLFCRKGLQDLDVLFIAGNIHTKRMFQYNMYEEAWKTLTGGTEDASC